MHNGLTDNQMYYITCPSVYSVLTLSYQNVHISHIISRIEIQFSGPMCARHLAQRIAAARALVCA